jgi:hypothetical protein
MVAHLTLNTPISESPALDKGRELFARVKRASLLLFDKFLWRRLVIGGKRVELKCNSF